MKHISYYLILVFFSITSCIPNQSIEENSEQGYSITKVPEEIIGKLPTKIANLTESKNLSMVDFLHQVGLSDYHKNLSEGTRSSAIPFILNEVSFLWIHLDPNSAIITEDTLDALINPDFSKGKFFGSDFIVTGCTLEKNREVIINKSLRSNEPE